ncbi:MAG: LPS export ABC transporter periplasmic protein LptC [Rhodobacteraceae bacterium]|nr:LPS export ABC transporter periplasmic protein LptC [Paracoccaceae bacterium]
MLNINSYSKMITILKILLPSIALLILSFLFFLPDHRTKLQAVNKIDKSILQVINKAGINQPSLRGTLASGSNLELYAKSVLPKNKDKSIIEVDEITARLEIDKKSWATAFANKGLINTTEKTAEMVGSVKIRGFKKIQIDASDLKIFYQRALVTTKKPVSMRGKFGMISAGSAEFYDMNQKLGEGYVLLFDKGVKMVYKLEEN